MSPIEHIGFVLFARNMYNISNSQHAKCVSYQSHADEKPKRNFSLQDLFDSTSVDQRRFRLSFWWKNCKGRKWKGQKNSKITRCNTLGLNICSCEYQCARSCIYQSQNVNPGKPSIPHCLNQRATLKLWIKKEMQYCSIECFPSYVCKRLQL